jgi:casein kinase 1
MVLAPSPAVVKTARRAAQQEGSRGGSREHISVQPLAPNSRRASQHRADRERERDSSLVAQHPYASASNAQNGAYRNTAYGNSSPVQYNGMGQLGNGHANSPVMPNTSDFMYGGQAGQRQSNGDIALPAPRANGAGVNVTKGVNVYGEQTGAGLDQDEHGGRKKSFWAALCCRE